MTWNFKVKRSPMVSYWLHMRKPNLLLNRYFLNTFAVKIRRSEFPLSMDARMNYKYCSALLLTLYAGLACAQAPAAPKSGIAVADVDSGVRAGQDFFRHVNGNWHKRNPMPDDKSSWGPTAQVNAAMRERVRTLIETAAGDSGNPDARKIAALFASAMDEKHIERLGIAPLRPELAAIAALRDKRALAAYLARLGALGASSPLDLSIHLDPKDAHRYLPDLTQGELGMLDRSYYLDQDAAQAAVRAHYLQFLGTLFTLLGDARAGAHAADVMAFETALAAAQWSASDSNDPLKTANAVKVSALAQLAPGFDWQAYLKAAQVPAGQRDILLSQPSYLQKFAQLSEATPLATWKNYLVSQLLGSYASTLSSPYADASHAFYGVTLGGKKARPARWQSGVTWTESSLGGPLGKLYVQRYFPPAHLARARQLVANVKDEFRSSLDQVEWMSPATRQEAQAKLASMEVKVGYPAVWQDFSGLAIRRDDLVGNLMRARQFKRRAEVGLLGKPVARGAWMAPPQTVSANYNGELNAITIPAGRLQLPYFDPDADDAVNYGAIASVIGHEISHAFDNYGGQYDSRGVLRDWFSAADRASFDARAQRMVEQYGRYSPLPGKHVDGQLTLGENIADNLGLALALRAYHRALGGKPGPVLDGYTADQRFFMGYARSRSKVLREELMLATLKRDEHAPDEVRVNGAVRNQDAFYAAFGVVPGDAMYLAPAERIRIW
jgi:putative endopeptidase